MEVLGYWFEGTFFFRLRLELVIIIFQMFADDCSRGNMVMREDQLLGIFLGESTTCLFRYIVKAEHESAILCYHLKIRTESSAQIKSHRKSLFSTSVKVGSVLFTLRNSDKSRCSLKCIELL